MEANLKLSSWCDTPLGLVYFVLFLEYPLSRCFQIHNLELKACFLNVLYNFQVLVHYSLLLESFKVFFPLKKMVEFFWLALVKGCMTLHLELSLFLLLREISVQYGTLIFLDWIIVILISNFLDQGFLINISHLQLPFFLQTQIPILIQIYESAMWMGNMCYLQEFLEHLNYQ